MFFRPLAAIILFTIGYTANAFSQQRLYTMSEATNGIRGKLAAERLRMFEWIPEKQAFTLLVTDKEGHQAWVKYEVPSMKSDTLLKPAGLNRKLFANQPLQDLPLFHWLSSSEAWFNMGNVYYKGVLAGDSMNFKLWCRLSDDAENVTVNNENKLIAYTVNNNLQLYNQEGISVEVTSDTSMGIVNGQSVHRDEFGIDRGIFFSPKGKLLAFYRMDQRMVKDYPIINWMSVPAVSNNIKYPMAGQPSHHVTLGVYDPIKKQTVYMKTGLPADHYLTSVTWSPDEQFIYIAILNREQNHLWLNQYKANTGELTKTIFEEKDPRYVHPMHRLTFMPGSNDQFIWHSERDGFDHLYLYNTNGKLIKQLTQGNWLVNSITKFNTKNKELVYTSSEESAMEKHIYAVNTGTGARRRITSEPGWHEVFTSDNGEYILDVFNSTTISYKAQVSSVKGNWHKTLLESTDPLKDFKRPLINNIIIKADNGTDLYGKLILPIGFDSTKKYPVIVYLYNGPGIQLIKNSFPSSGNLWYEYMAQKGFIVFTMDGRGSSNRGLAFEQSTFRNLGVVEMKDQLAGVSYLRSLPYVDDKRMGVHGWSYGGFMTTSLMLNYPDVFKVGVAGGPVMDWKMYEIMYTERYMDTPQENPEGYAKANLLTQTKNLKGDLLLIHGTNDDVVVWQHSINFIKACVDNEVQVDYFVYPGHLHNVQGKDRVHLMQKITDYFIDKLGSK